LGYRDLTLVDRTQHFVIYRAFSADERPFLIKVPASFRPTTFVLRQIEQELEIVRELDPAYILRPIRIERSADLTALLLEDCPYQPLSKRLQAPLPIGVFLHLATEIVIALSEVHRHGLVHKDIKPANIFADEDGNVKLSGFGIASRLSRERQPPGPPESIAGTFAYMAPEQTGRMNRSLDMRSDLYALGVTFYEMLTGRLPFSASDSMEWVHAHIALQAKPPRERVRTIPKTLSDMIMKLLEKNAEERYQTARGVQADLEICMAAWQAHADIEPFELGTHDIPDRLLIPERLYGRQREVAKLLAAFDRVVSSGKPELVLVSGYSDIGKSAVVNELHKALVPPHALFAGGKFDQYMRDIPYATLAQALQSLVRQVLCKGDKEIDEWRKAIKKAVGPNGGLIISLVPDLAALIGKQPPVQEVPPQEAQNRFSSVFRRLLSVLLVTNTLSPCFSMTCNGWMPPLCIYSKTYSAISLSSISYCLARTAITRSIQPTR
jgi:hypothetical protein